MVARALQSHRGLVRYRQFPPNRLTLIHSTLLHLLVSLSSLEQEIGLFGNSSSNSFLAFFQVVELIPPLPIRTNSRKKRLILASVVLTELTNTIINSAVIKIVAYISYLHNKLFSIGKHDQCFEHNLLLFRVGIFISSAKGAYFLVKNCNMLSKPLTDKLTQVKSLLQL